MDEPGIFIPLWIIVRLAECLIIGGTFWLGHYFGKRMERARAGRPEKELVLVAPIDATADYVPSVDPQFGVGTPPLNGRVKEKLGNARVLVQS